MDAELVWNVWRRILREPALQDSVLRPGFADRARAHGLSPEEARVAAAYAAKPTMTRWATETYRFRLVRTVTFALELGAPLTTRLLRAAGHDVRGLVLSYLEAAGYPDDGPFAYRCCESVLAFLERTGLSPRPPELADTMALERTAIALLRSLTDAPASLWSSPGGEAEGAVLVRTATCALVTTSHAISGWLSDPDSVAPGTCDCEPEYYLVYFATPEAEHDIAELSGQAKALLEALAEPRTLEEARALVVPPGDEDECDGALETFLEIGAVRRAPRAQATSEPRSTT